MANPQPGVWPPPEPPRTGGSRVGAVLLSVLALLVAVGVGVGVGTVISGHTNVVHGTAIARPSGGAPTGLTAAGAIRVGQPGAKVVVRVVQDLQCPACKMFEALDGKVLQDVATNGTAVVDYDVISFLDRASTTQYSSRAGNAAYCVAGADRSKFQSWLAAMFRQQPPEGSDGLPNSKLIQIAEQAGYTDPAVAQCIKDRSYDSFLKQQTNSLINGGIDSTPTIFINGKQAGTDQIMTPEAFAQAIANAK